MKPPQLVQLSGPANLAWGRERINCILVRVKCKKFPLLLQGAQAEAEGCCSHSLFYWEWTHISPSAAGTTCSLAVWDLVPHAGVPWRNVCKVHHNTYFYTFETNQITLTYTHTHTRMSGRAAHLLYRGEMPSCCTQGSTHGWRPLGKLPHWGKLPTGSSILASPASTQVPPPSQRAPEVPLAQGQPPCLSWHSSLTQAQLPTLGSGLRNHSPLGSFCSNQGPLNQSSNQQSPILQNCADKTKGLSPNSLPDTRQWNPPPWDITFELLRAKRNAQL